MKLAGRTARVRVRSARLRAAAPTLVAAQADPRISKSPRERVLTIAPQERGALPDLLHAQPAISVDEPALLHALAFAFVAGSAGGSLQSALARTALAASSFTPEALQDGLFLDELIAIAFDFPSSGKPAPIDRVRLRKLLTRPPRERADIELRQAVLRELSDDAALRSALERVYAAVAVLPMLLDDEGSDAHLDINPWRIDVLRAIRDAIAALDTSFAGAHSALSRLFTFGERVRASRGYEQLAALLDFEADSARAELQLSLGADGRIRSLAIVSMRERRESPFYVSPVVRLWRRLCAFVQGYTMGPNELVDRWLETVWEGVLEYLPGLLQLKGDLEFYLGALHFKRLAEAKGLAVCLPELSATTEPATAKRVHGLWNPLLLTQPSAPVATDLELPGFVYTCITTGPNSGGKTRFLQALAMCQLLGQAGAFVPARTAMIRLVSGMFVSLGEAPHADQKEGRLGMELTRIRALFEHAQVGSLVILDELCSGTNPSEGEEIMRMLLELLHELEHEVHITTHFLSFAQSLQSETQALGLHFLQVELDDTEHPTYRFVPGVATTSLAQQTAARLGVTREQLRQLIRQRERS
jgi:DNA mismatch repair protein MutS2